VNIEPIVSTSYLFQRVSTQSAHLLHQYKKHERRKLKTGRKAAVNSTRQSRESKLTRFPVTFRCTLSTSEKISRPADRGLDLETKIHATLSVPKENAIGERRRRKPCSENPVALEKKATTLK
jgi:hypothetical protein